MERPIVMGAGARSQREITKNNGWKGILKRFGPSVVEGPWGVVGKGRQGLTSRLGWLSGDGPMIWESIFVEISNSVEKPAVKRSVII